jgi:predicted short-subunit dehydrogenase-like oxidoreductase (DUF2520 family)
MTPKLTDPTYLIIGDGHVARHFEHYFTLSRIPSLSWSRKQNSLPELRQSFTKADVILVLISDPAIESFLVENSFLSGKPVVHFSGRVVTEHAVGMHPLNTFPAGKYSKDVYEKTAFVCERDRTSFASLFPRLPNPHFEIDRDKKDLYHALCVMSGNFTTILWEKAFTDFREKLGLPHDVLRPYLETIAGNLARPHTHSVLTGPIVRKDVETVHSHLQALDGDAYKKIYESFIATLQPGLLK